MKENETLLILDGGNQRIGWRSHSAGPRESRGGPPPLEVGKYLRCANDCEARARPSRVRSGAPVAEAAAPSQKGTP